MPESHEILMVRHGQSTANASTIWQGQMDFPLSDEGRRQAEAAGRALKGERLDAVYSSPLSRAFETARIIAREAGFSGEVFAMDDLMERRGGILEGTTAAEREQRYPDLMRKWRLLPEEEGWAVVGAETDEDVLARFQRAISKIRGRHGAGERILVVSHGGVMRAFMRDVFGAGVLPGTVRAANASITRIEWSLDGEMPRLLELASTDHLLEDPSDTPPTSGTIE
jgi:broad specificity phosphatase PhoE